MKKTRSTTVPHPLPENTIECSQSVYQLESLQDLFDLDVAETQFPEQINGDCPCKYFGSTESNDRGLRQFEALFTPLPEIYSSEAGVFMDTYQAGGYAECFSKISLDTMRQEPTGLIPLYLASAALAIYDLPRAKEFLDLFVDSGDFILGYWWYRAMRHILLQEDEKADEAMKMVLISPIPRDNRFLTAWSMERKRVTRRFLEAQS